LPKYSIVKNFIIEKVNHIFFSIVFILILIVFINQFFLIINESINSGLKNIEIISLIFLKIIRDLPFILIIGFVFAIVHSLNKLSSTSELLVLITAVNGKLELFKLLRPYLFKVLAIISVITLFIVPRANSQIDFIDNNIENRPENLILSPGKFYSYNSDTTFFANNVSFELDDKQSLKNIFVSRESSQNNIDFIFANEGIKSFDETGNLILKLKNGKIYQFAINEVTSISNFKNLDLKLEFEKKHLTSEESNAKSIHFFDLFNNLDKKKLQEFFYRISFPTACLVLVFLSLCFISIEPRKKRNFSLFYTFIAIVIYFNFILYIRNLEYSEYIDIIIFSIAPHLVIGIIAFIISVEYTFRKN